MVTLPSVNDIARDIGSDVDHDAIFLARKALRSDIGKLLAEPLLATYDRLGIDRRPIRPTPPMPGVAPCATPASTCWRRATPERGRRDRHAAIPGRQ